MKLEIERVVSKFKNIYGLKPQLVTAAPGRINLIGEHTDYNDGFVLPMGIDKQCYMAISSRADTKAFIYADSYNEQVAFDLDEIKPDKKHSWSNYERGIVKTLMKMGFNLKGFNGLVGGNVPEGAGLSSSAAIESATICGLNELFNLKLPPIEMVKIARQSESEFVGVNCGIMDQFASVLSKSKHCILIDCRSLKYEYIKVKNVTFVIINTNVKRRLVDSVYNERRKQCERAVEILASQIPGVKALRDVKPQQFELHKDRLPYEIRKRATHVIYENERVKEAVEALKNEDVNSFGKLMYQSHESLQTLFEVSCHELDFIVEFCFNSGKVAGARMTGAGFGGCAVAIVNEKDYSWFKQQLADYYEQKFGFPPSIFQTKPCSGAVAWQV